MLMQIAHIRHDALIVQRTNQSTVRQRLLWTEKLCSPLQIRDGVDFLRFNLSSSQS